MAEEAREAELAELAARAHKSGVSAAEAALEQARRRAMERLQAEGVEAVA